MGQRAALCSLGVKIDCITHTFCKQEAEIVLYAASMHEFSNECLTGVEIMAASQQVLDTLYAPCVFFCHLSCSCGGTDLLCIRVGRQPKWRKKLCQAATPHLLPAPTQAQPIIQTAAIFVLKSQKSSISCQIRVELNTVWCNCCVETMMLSLKCKHDIEVFHRVVIHLV